jgi:hypothetical protein
MKEIGTFMGGAGKYQATIFEMDSSSTKCYVVSCSQNTLPSFCVESKFTKFFMNEKEAEDFALKYISEGSKPEFLSE